MLGAVVRVLIIAMLPFVALVVQSPIASACVTKRIGAIVFTDCQTSSPGGAAQAGGGSGHEVPAEPAVPVCLFTIDDWCKMPATDVWRRIDTGATVDLVATASRAAASLTVPQPVMYVGPDPRNNKWNALAVGLPVWVWADEQAPQSTSVNEQGIQIDMTATRGEVSVDWGDGTTTVCASMTPRPPSIEPMTKSPCRCRVNTDPVAPSEF